MEIHFPLKYSTFSLFKLKPKRYIWDVGKHFNLRKGLYWSPDKLEELGNITCEEFFACHRRQTAVSPYLQKLLAQTQWSKQKKSNFSLNVKYNIISKLRQYRKEICIFEVTQDKNKTVNY